MKNRISSDIKKYGLHIIHVLAEGELPNFSYTVGMFETFKQPEMIIVGLNQDISHTILNNIAYDYKQGRKFSDGEMNNDILEDYQCLILRMDQIFYDEYLGQAIDHYKGLDFPVMQIVWPTTSNQYPYDKDAPEGFKKWQPVLGKL